MYSKEMYQYGSASSAIRQLFAYSQKRALEIGKENIYDFSIGNPSVPAPEAVKEAMIRFINEKEPLALHGYTAAQGDPGVRKAIADDLNDRYDAGVSGNDLYMTCGAAASLKITLTALYEDGDEIITPTPFFPEYRVFAESAGYKFVTVDSEKKTFQLDMDVLEKNITEHTKAVIINSPNNPSGVVYTEEKLNEFAALLTKKSAQYGHTIYVISDEPYRELTYGKKVAYVPAIYPETVVCYSYSKSLSLPGERIGYILVPPTVSEHDGLYFAVAGAGRALGYVCAPSLLQFTVGACAKVRPDLSVYEENRKLLYDSLTEIGYECIYPDGAFYLCVKALEDDAQAFSDRAKKYELLLVPGDSFCAYGYVRLAYCVDNDMIKRSMPAFKKLYDEYNK